MTPARAKPRSMVGAWPGYEFAGREADPSASPRDDNKEGWGGTGAVGAGDSEVTAGDE